MSGGRFGAGGALSAASGGANAAQGGIWNAGGSTPSLAGGLPSVPLEVGRPCASGADCGGRTGCDPESGTCVLPCSSSCPAGKRCMIERVRTPPICFTTCEPGVTGTCPAGLACGRGFAAYACLPRGTSQVGMPCTSTSFSTGCAEDGLICAAGICQFACTPGNPGSRCPQGTQCIPSRDVCGTGDEAALGELCAAGSDACAGDGTVFRGICDEQRVCVPSCSRGESCPTGQSCDQGVCRTPCDLSAETPGCQAPQQCAPLDQVLAESGFCTSHEGNPARLGEVCAPLELGYGRGCASDGKAWRGRCVSPIQDVICAPNCHADEDCPPKDRCIEFACQPAPCVRLAADPGCQSPAQCNQGVCTMVAGQDVAIGEPCLPVENDRLSQSCGSDGKAWRGHCVDTTRGFRCLRFCGDDGPCDAGTTCAQEFCQPDEP